MMNDILLRFDGASIERPGSGVVIKNLTWTLHIGDKTWAIIGPNGSGKSTLAETIAGKHRLTAGTLTWPAWSETGVDPYKLVRIVPFRENSRLFSPADYYYQQRFDFGDPPDCPTAAEYLRAGPPTSQQELDSISARLGIAGLLNQKLLTLSTGQMRRTRLARALLSHPRLLILDDPFCGLDAAGRQELDTILAGLAEAGTQLILLPGDDVPSWVANTLVLPAMHTAANVCPTTPPTAVRTTADNDSIETGSRSKLAIEMRNVRVRHGGKTILEGINWRVGVGERWALVGGNGSGKTTLLSLVCGDHPAAYSNVVRLFGRQRGSGETIWDVKRQVGLVSPELHQYFTVPMSAFDAAATGWHDVLTPRPVEVNQAEEVHRLFAIFGLTEFTKTRFSRLSTGLQRLVLFLRAVVKQPPLLILDEPFQALDAGTISRLRGWLDLSLQEDQTLVMVTHRPAELPACVTHRLELKNGRVVE